MLLVGWLEELFALGEFPQIMGFPIFISAIRQIALLIKRISPIVGRAVEVIGHGNKIIKSLLLRHRFNLVTSHTYFQPINLSSQMNYNQLTFHKANPFYKQDFMPDRAWFNRKAKEYPSEMPSGKDFFAENGRKHFVNRFNHSQIESQSILKSPQRYPFQNRIALDKTYMRSLHTIDIEGASSSTRINQSIKNKYKAQDQLARRYNQSLDLKSKEKTEEEKRREVALKQYEEYQERAVRKQTNPQLEDSKVTVKSINPQQAQKPSLKKQLTEQYKRFIMQNSSNKFSKDIPKPLLTQSPNSSQLYGEQPSYKTLEASMRRENTYNPNHETINKTQRPTYERQFSNKESKATGEKMVYPAPTPPSHYQYQFNGQKLKNSEQYQRILKYEDMTRRILQNPKELRKNNPTNLSLSFNLAGQSIVSN